MTRKKFKVFGKMLPLIEELESRLSDTPTAERTGIVGQIIMTSLMTSNPIKAMRDAINFHNSIKGTKKASYLVGGMEKHITRTGPGVVKVNYYECTLF